MSRTEERLVRAGVLFVPADAGNDPVDRVVERNGLQEVIPDVRIKQEREIFVFVFENLTNVVLVVLG